MFGASQKQALSKYAPFISANTGAQMDPDAIKFIFEQIDPFFQWKDQASIWEDETFPLYYKNLYSYQIKKFIAAGTIADKAYDLDEVFQAKQIWKDLSEMKIKTEALQAKLDATASDDRKTLAAEAKRHYDQFNYFDALRFAEAAVA